MRELNNEMACLQPSRMGTYFNCPLPDHGMVGLGAGAVTDASGVIPMDSGGDKISPAPSFSLDLTSSTFDPGHAGEQPSVAPVSTMFRPWNQIPATFAEGSGGKYYSSPESVSTSPAPGKVAVNPGKVAVNPGTSEFNQLATAVSNIANPLIRAQYQITLNQAAMQRKPVMVSSGFFSSTPTYAWVLGGLAVLAVLGIAFSVRK
ncbi:MAG: hypothetical protein GZ088_09775 [Acidipila sp.]|nr:hypothetical protein [Acidipila sp.]